EALRHPTGGERRKSHEHPGDFASPANTVAATNAGAAEAHSPYCDGRVAAGRPEGACRSYARAVPVL
ncbi:MAG: hypothetical protein PVH31_01465, partial [Ectothiorhodospiraceae bacterium]